ncbi:hypothetical protein IAT38_000223 [Cryptococcus sp. DSM 104549]
MAYNLTSTTLPDLVHTYLPPSLHPFILLSYPIPPSDSHAHLFAPPPTPPPTLYGKGPADFAFVAFWAVAFTLAREFTMARVFAPFVRWYLGGGPAGVKGMEREEKREAKAREHVVTRFSEQAWSWLYCTISWSIGMLILYRIPSPSSPEQLWGTYPAFPLPALTKFYYLAQLGWWFHQIYVINAEKRRKDHWQMFGHHILTIALIVGSYKMNFTRVGVVIHCLMDFCDIWLPFAKMLRYLSLTTACDATFVVFLVSWLLTRQIGLFLVLRTCYVDAPKFIPFKWAPEEELYLTSTVYYSFCSLLAMLWVLATVWFYLACMVAVRVVRGLGAEDSRSEEDSEVASEDDLLDAVPNCVGTGTSAKGNGAEALRKRR